MSRRECTNHQSLRKISVKGVKPAESEWYECRCGQKLLMSVIASVPQDPEIELAAARGVTISRQYSAADKTDWANLEQAVLRNHVLDQVAEIGKLLVPRTDAVEEGEGYIQQGVEQVESAKMLLHRLLLETHKNFKNATLEAIIFDMLEDGPTLAEDPMYELYLRLCCIDSLGREWQTKDLALHPESGRHTRLNP